MTNLKQILGGVGLAFCVASLTHATTVTYSVTGVVDLVNYFPKPLFLLPIEKGDSFGGSFIVNSGDSDPDPTLGRYNLQSFSFTSGGVTLSGPGSFISSGLQVRNDSVQGRDQPYDGFKFYSYSNSSGVVGYPTSLVLMEFEKSVSKGDTFLSDDLPLGRELALLNESRFFFQFQNGDTVANVDMRVSGVSAVVGGTAELPEPSSVALVGLGLVALAASTRRRFPRADASRAASFSGCRRGQ